jgi:hypothetical protein
VGIVERWIEEQKAIKPVLVSGHPMFRHQYRSAKAAKNGYDKAVSALYVSAIAERRFTPDPMDVLICLASDSQSVENAGNFENWAAEMGLDTDSIKARNTFEHCLRAGLELRSFLGRKAYDTLTEIEG